MFRFQGKGSISDHSGGSKRFELFPPVLRVWLSGANLWCTALLSLEEPAPLSQRPGCGAESNGNTAEDSVRPGYSTWWGSQTRGVAQQLLGSLARWRSSFLDSGHTEKVWSRCLCLSSNQYPPHVSTTQPFFPNSHCCSLSEGQERSTGVAEPRPCCPQSNGGPLNVVMS